MSELTSGEQKAYNTFKKFEQIYTDGKLELIDELVSEDFRHHAPFPTPDGKDEYKKFQQQFREAFPDFTSTPQEEVVSENKVAQAFVMQATHKGEFMDIPATGNKVEMEGISIYRIEDGKIAEEWVQPDMMAMMQQLGVAPAPDEADQ